LPEPVRAMDDLFITIMVFLGAGLLAYVLIPGLFVMWDRVLDYMSDGGNNPK